MRRAISARLENENWQNRETFFSRLHSNQEQTTLPPRYQSKHYRSLFLFQLLRTIHGSWRFSFSFNITISLISAQLSLTILTVVDILLHSVFQVV